MFDRILLMYGRRSTGKGRDSAEILRALLNIPQPPTSFGIFNNTISSTVTDVSESYLILRTREGTAQNEADHLAPITMCVDGSR